MTRSENLSRLRGHSGLWDMAVVGGGATGVGIAVDAASRGYSVLLLEQSDFGKGTSSRGTKLVHGGVRYLEQGNIPLVREALKERELLLRNAPHLVRSLAFVVPCYAWWETPFYGVGLKLYNLLGGRKGFGKSRVLSRGETQERIPNVKVEGLRGGVLYYDGQFDDARLLSDLARTAFKHGAAILNHAPVTRLLKGEGGTVEGVCFRDAETGEEFEARARVVVNATGPFTDELRRMGEKSVEPIVAHSQGTHLVFDRSFLPGNEAIMVPHTSDGRILFVIPWHGHTLVGTTDVAVGAAPLEPVATEKEIEFILQTASLYLAKKPSRGDVLSVFAGIRPLVNAGAQGNTASLSRSHTIRVEPNGLISICGGKWTTYRRMAEDCVNQASKLAKLPERACVTQELPIQAPAIPAGTPLHAALPYTDADVVWAVHEEMARTVEDVLARRTRALFLNAAAAMAMSPRVAEIMASELGCGPEWVSAQVQALLQVARGYLID